MELINELVKMNTPAPYEPGEPEFWTDPHISRQMLKAHLDETWDAASYRPGRIDAICDYLIRRMGLETGDRVADLGCGPGLYSVRLARKGLKVIGLDFSETAIGYARAQVDGMANAPEFRVGNYLDWHEAGQYDAALLIYEDYGVLAPDERRRLLANVYDALRPGGSFALDVASRITYDKRKVQAARNWQMLPDGFWRPHPHLVLEERLSYETDFVGCDRYIVWDGEVKDYHVFLTYYSPESIREELEAGGFEVEEMLSGLDGDAWREDSAQIGVICRKK